MRKIFITIITSVFVLCQISLAQHSKPQVDEAITNDSLSLLSAAKKEFLEAHHMLDDTQKVATPDELQQVFQRALVDIQLSKRSGEYFWCSQGPDNFSGNIQALLIDQNNENHIYAGTESGGLFESFDQGVHWNLVPNWDKHMHISSLAQGSDGTIYVGTGQKISNFIIDNIGGAGVYYLNPNDPSAVWTLIPGTNTWNIQSIATNQVNNKIFIGSHNGLFSWDKDQGGVPQNALSNTNTCHEVKVSSNGQLVLCRLGTNPASGTLVSNDGGVSFTSIHGSSADNLIPAGSYIFCKFVISKIPVNGSYVCYLIGRTSNSVITFRSDDNGLTWKQVSLLPQQVIGNVNTSYYAASLWINPSNPNQLLLGTGNVFLGTYIPNSEILVWEPLSTLENIPNTELYLSEGQFDIQVDTQNKIYIATYGGLYISQDFGSSFQLSGYNLHNTIIYNVASGGNGKLVSGTMYHGALINNLTNVTPKSFNKVNGLDHFDVAMSSFNTDISFVGRIFGGLHRVIDSGNDFSISPFIPNYIGFAPGTNSNFNFRTSLAFGEYYDPNSKDSVTYLPTSNIPTGTTISVPSMTTGKFIEQITTSPLYFDSWVDHDPSLTLIDYLITDANTGETYQLYPLTWSFLLGNGEPEVGDIILVSAPFEQIIEIGVVSTYNRYFAQHPITGKLLDMNINQQMVNVAWDTLRVADPYQSILVTHTRRNGGELYATRDALRTGLVPKWSKVVEGVGDMLLGEIAISSNLEHIYVGTSTGLWRVDGFGAAYSTNEDFLLQTDLRLGEAPMISKIQIHNEAVSGISINPNNAGDVLITLTGIGVSSKLKRSNTANTDSSAGNFQSVFGNLPTNLTYNDALIDVYDANKLLVGHTFGVWASDNGGATWSNATAGMGNTNVYRIIQNWRINDSGTTKPGEIYVATTGAGIFSTGECTDFASTPSFVADEANFDLILYPNPCSEYVDLRIESSEVGYAQVQVFSIAGQIVHQEHLSIAAGQQEVTLNTSDFKPGFYFVHLNLGERRLSRKLMRF